MSREISLSGKKAHIEMAPDETRRRVLAEETEIPSYARRSAVLVLLVSGAKDLCDSILFIRRNSYKGIHSGQIAFPGGKCEIYDISITATALREAKEEVGLPEDEIEILCELTPLYVPVSEYVIYPVLSRFTGDISKLSSLSVNGREVVDYKLIPVEEFYTGSNKKTGSFFSGDIEVHNIPYYDVCGYKIWGATAMIMSEVLDILPQFENIGDGSLLNCRG